MKTRKYEDKEFFTYWRRENTAKYGKYYWLQLDYDFVSKETFNICFEINDEVENSVFWPNFDNKVTSNIPYKNIDFRKARSLEVRDGAANYYLEPNEINDYLSEKRKDYLINELSSSERPYASYDDYHRYHKGSCLDIDAIENVNDEGFVGIETTSLYKEMKDRNEAFRLFSEILEKRFFKPGFHQLEVQNKFLKKINAKHYLLVYNECYQQGSKVLKEDGCALVLLIDEEVIKNIKVKEKSKILEKVKYLPFVKAYEQIIGKYTSL